MHQADGRELDALQSERARPLLQPIIIRFSESVTPSLRGVQVASLKDVTVQFKCCARLSQGEGNSSRTVGHLESRRDPGDRAHLGADPAVLHDITVTGEQH